MIGEVEYQLKFVVRVFGVEVLTFGFLFKQNILRLSVQF
jgi:hypothetical protein